MNHGGGPAAARRAGRALTVATLVIVVTLVTAAGAGASQMVFLGNALGESVTSYPTATSGNSAPAASFAQSAEVGTVTFDSAGDMWVGVGSGGQPTTGVLSEYDPGQLASGSSTPSLQLTTTVGVNTGGAFDSAGDLWVASQGSDSISEFTAAQLRSPETTTPAITIGGVATQPNGIAVDAGGDVWVSSYTDDTLSEYTPDQLTTSGSPAPAVVISATDDGSLSGPARLAFDSAGDLWVANRSGNSVVEYTPAELTTSGTPTPAVTLSSTDGSLDGPNAVGFDSDGDLWVADESGESVVEFAADQLTTSGAPTPVDTIAGPATEVDDPWVLALSSLSVATSTSVASSQNPSLFGQLVTFSATVAPTAPTTTTPTGTVTFFADGATIGSVALSGARAALTTSTLSIGPHTITADYGGDQTFAPSGGSLASPQVVVSAGGMVTGPPAVSPRVPRATGAASAAFTGSVVPDGLATTTYFEYGLDPKYAGGGPVVYDLRTPAQAVGSGSGAVPVSASVSGLVPNAVYHVRLVASNSAGTTVGADQRFTTLREAPPGPPVLSTSFDASVVHGVVLIKLPSKSPGARAHTTGNELSKGTGFVPLTEARQLPVGTEVDARRGTLQLTAASTVPHGHTQTGTFSGGLFAVTQAGTGLHKGLTTLALLEGAFPGAPTYASCTVGKARHRHVIAVTATLSPRVLQILKAHDDHGNFSTRGRYGAATVRGTTWTMSDQCDGTLTTVQRGTVDVRDFATRKTVVLHAGQHYLAKPA